MNHALNLSLTRQLDRLEAGGRQSRSRAAARRAAAAGLGVAAWTSLGVAVALALVHLVVLLLAWTVLVGATVLIPLAAGASVFTVRRRTVLSRAEALAIVDRRLALKDRATMSDEFLQGSAPDGFREAALSEAQPWIERAVGDRLAARPVALNPDRASLAAAVVALLLVIALLLTAGAGRDPDPAVAGLSRGGGGGRDGARGDAGDRAGSVPDGDASGIDRAAGAGAALPDDGATSARGGDAAASQRLQAGEAKTLPTAGKPGTPADASSTPAGRASASGRAPGAAGEHAGQGADAASLNEPGAADGTGAQPSEAGRRASPGEEQPRAAQRQGKGGAAPATRKGATAPEVAADKSASAASKNAANRQGRNGSPAPDPDGDRNPDTSGGNQNGGQQRSSGRGPPGNNRGEGKDTLKNTRGIGALMLAVPMEDRLIGTTNPGGVRSTIRKATLRRGGDPAPGAAEARGAQNGDSGRVLHRPSSLHDERLVRDIFRRTGGQ